MLPEARPGRSDSALPVSQWEAGRPDITLLFSAFPRDPAHRIRAEPSLPATGATCVHDAFITTIGWTD